MLKMEWLIISCSCYHLANSITAIADCLFVKFCQLIAFMSNHIATFVICPILMSTNVHLSNIKQFIQYISLLDMRLIIWELIRVLRKVLRLIVAIPFHLLYYMFLLTLRRNYRVETIILCYILPRYFLTYVLMRVHLECKLVSIAATL